MNRIKALLVASAIAVLSACGGVEDQTDLTDAARRGANLVSAAGTMTGGGFTLRAELGRPVSPTPLR